ncbi:hypothetical protein F5Y17DRAFT_137748 [Xylariaceae sp. FL0594]|nr:hypothetical protein F5Y17DRAFT_137748 [Xylariaceae sp. FL0594]
MVSMSVSVLKISTQSYVSGLRITDTNGKSWDLGYFRLSDSVTFRATHITGFHIAQDSRGIRGIRVLGGDGSISEWIGYHRDIPRRRLVLRRTTQVGESVIRHIKGDFDMLSLSISGDTGDSTDMPETDDPLWLPESATWLPEPPEDDLSLFGVFDLIGVLGLSWFYHGQPPFRTLVFGDSSGPHNDQALVTSIEVGGADNDIQFLQLNLDRRCHGQISLILGRAEDMGRPYRQHRFDISSSQGERIVGLDAYYSAEDGGCLVGLAFYTNFKRHVLIHPCPPPPSCHTSAEQNVVERLWPEEGNIVGFFGKQRGEGTLVCIGIICIRMPCYGCLCLQI